MAGPTTITRDKQSIFNKARKDKFLLVLTLPSILRDANAPLLSERTKELVQLESLNYSVWGSIVPDVIIPSQDLGMQGQTYKVTSQTRSSYPLITVNFNVDNLFNNYWLLWKWLEVLNDPKESGMPEHFAKWKDGGGNTNPSSDKSKQIIDDLRNRTPDGISDEKFKKISMENNFLDYQTIMTVYAKNEYDQDVIKFNFSNAFITQLGGINYSYRDSGEIESSFQFAFNQLTIDLIDV